MTLALRVASRYTAKVGSAGAQELASALQDVKKELLKWRAWSKGFDQVLRQAQVDAEGLPPGLVWQAPFVDFWKPFDPIERRLLALVEDIEDVGYDNPDLKALTTDAVLYTDPPRGARIQDAIANPTFVQREDGEYIAYPEKDLVSWKRRFSGWVEVALRGVDRIMAQTQGKT